MTIKGIEFEFNPGNAAHVERVQAAAEAYNEAHKADAALADGTLPGAVAFMRADNRSIKAFVDTILGPGSAEALGWDPDDHDKALDLMQTLSDSISAAMSRLTGNRKQRRAKR